MSYPIYDPLVQYCPTRRNLEERTNNLVSRLAMITGRLLLLIGNNHHLFTETKAECTTLRAEIAEARRNLDDHRVLHQC